MATVCPVCGHEEATKSVTEHRMCQKPDRDVPGIKCGYPLPCPYHTVILNTTEEPLRICHTEPLSTLTQQRLLDIGKALKSDRR
jgi:hypothetical protein